MLVWRFRGLHPASLAAFGMENLVELRVGGPDQPLLLQKPLFLIIFHAVAASINPTSQLNSR